MSIPCDLLLHPELLTNQQMVSVLQERHLRIPDIALLPRDQLLELFHQFCVPYGQRRYKDSGRGKILNKIRSLNETTPEWTKVMKIHNSSNNNVPQKHNAERIKPPPDLLSGHIKRIKISVELDRCQVTDDQSNKRKIDMDTTATIDAAPPPMKRERKHNPITWP